MKVYQTDKDGYYVGEAMADPSPLEPGVYLIPGGCVKQPPPDFVFGLTCPRWKDGKWIVEKVWP